MNPEKEINEKKDEIETINRIIKETLIMSQEKELQYLKEKEKLEEEIKELEKIKGKKRKIWIIKGEWRKRAYKYE